MSEAPHYALYKAIFAALVDDDTLMGLVQSVYDRPEQGAELPYVTVGDARSIDASGINDSTTEHTVVLNAWSQEGGRRQAALILDAIFQALHNKPLALTQHEAIEMRVLSTDIRLEGDGWTYRGAMTLRVVLRATV
jgi:hypothetical protein